ncbi:transmembrane channel-like isoform X3 [Rhodnius prolixus]|uniref:transmembrane channel-like isoform X3 n=1 Tax=Rhodnius prolixus TaxID=13249 RepID=UPI003D18D0D3
MIVACFCTLTLLQIEPDTAQSPTDRLATSKVEEDKGRTNAESPAGDKVRFTREQQQLSTQQADGKVGNEEGEDEEDEYSASVSAIMVRQANRQSWNKRSARRRGSSPFSPDQESAISNLRRRSSVFTTSSGDTAIDIEEKAKQEQIYQQIKLHKEVLSQVKYQPWPIRKKLKLVQTAKAYIKQHEGALQERLAHNRRTKDVLAHFKILMINQWNHLKRELLNMSNLLIPWELRIKEIESHFGSVVASYFIFLRWLFSVNLVIATVLITFIAVPEVLMARRGQSGGRKEMLEDEKQRAMNLVTLWNFEGVLKYSPLFYGYYNMDDEDKDGVFRYRLPLAYFTAGLAVYMYSFVAILRKMAENSRQSKLSEKDDECVFTWKIFTGWDYMIGNAETAHNRTASIVLGFREALLEEAEKKRNDGRNWKLTSVRILTHLNVAGLLCTSMYAVILVVDRSRDVGAEASWWRQSEVTLVVSIIGFVYPMVFDLIRLIERYHPRKALRLQLARIMVLNLLNLYSFIFATFSKIEKMTIQLNDLKPTANTTSIPSTSSPSIYANNIINPIKDLVNSTASETSIYSFFEESTADCSIKVPCSSTTTTLAVAALLLNATSPFSVDYNSTPVYNESVTSNDLYSTQFKLTENITVDKWNEIYSDFTKSFTENLEEFTTAPTTETSSESTEDYSTSTTLEKLLENSTDSSTSTQQSMFTPANATEFKEKLCYITINCSEINKFGTYLENTTIISTTLSNHHNHSEADTTLSPNTDILDVTEPDAPVQDLSSQIHVLDPETRKKLRNLCWETMFGQELVKLTIMDLMITITSIMIMDFMRAVFVRVMNNCWCWDLEKTFPQYGDFKIAENILHLVNNQGMVWMGMFFSPGLPLINLLKLVIIMYMRSWAVLTCNVPHEVVFKASRSNNFYLALLLTMLFLCVLPVGFAIVWLQPSWHCGPFSNYKRISHIFTRWLKRLIPATLHKVLDYIASPGIVIPLLMLLVLIIYYLVSLTNSLREANNDLKIQLRRERTEERRKMLQMVDKKRRGLDSADIPFNKWRKLLSSVPEIKSPVDNATKETSAAINSERKELISNLLKSTARKSSNTSDEGFSPLEPDTPRDTKANCLDEVNKSSKTRTVRRSALKNRNSPAERTSTDGQEVDNTKCHNKKLQSKSRADSVTSTRSGENIPQINIITSDTNGNIASGSKENIGDNILNENDVKETCAEIVENSRSIDSSRYSLNQHPPEESAKKPWNSRKFPIQQRNNEDVESEETLMHIGDSYESIPLSIMQMQELVTTPSDVARSKDVGQMVGSETERKSMANAIASELERRHRGDK